MTYDINLFADQKTANRASEGTWRAARSTRDGSQFIANWEYALLFEGRVFGVNAGTITTPVTGKTAITSAQPDIGISIPDGTAAIPVNLTATVETGSTTLGVGGLMFAVSTVIIGAGTSTATTPVPLNMLAAAQRSSVATVGVAYSGNGTDPLTAGNFYELARQQFILDSDAATSGMMHARLNYTFRDCPVFVADGGSICTYSEHGTNAPSIYAAAAWAELAETDL